MSDRPGVIYTPATEGLRCIDPTPYPERTDKRLDKLESDNAELQRIVTSLVMRVSIMERHQEGDRVTARAIPWQAIADVTQRPGEARDLSMDELIHFANNHAPWAITDTE